MNLKKGILSVVSAATLFGAVSPATSFAQSTKPSLEVTEEQVAEVRDMFDLIREIEQSNLNMEDLSTNEKSEIDKLSKEAQEFYYIFEQAVNESGSDMDKALVTLATYYHSNVDTSPKTGGQVSALSIGSVKKYNLSNQQVNEINKAAGVYGSGWAFLAAIAKIFAKSPTALTAMLIAIPAMGIAVINACNRYNKGIVITDVRIGATHSWSCAAKK